VQLDIKAWKKPNTIIIGDFDAPISQIGKLTRQKTQQENSRTKYNTIDQMDLTDNYRIFHWTAAEYIFYSGAHGIFRHKASLNECKKIGKASGVLLNQNWIKLEINKKKNHRKYSKT
jgi:hypothetical protein